jgi:hypothetical protein
MANRRKGKDNGNDDEQEREQERVKEAARQARIKERKDADDELAAVERKKREANKAAAKAKREAKAAREAQAAKEAQEAQALAEAKAKRDAESADKKAKAKEAEAEEAAKAKREAEAQAKREAEARAEEDAKAQSKREAEAEAQAKKEAEEAKAKEEADAKAKAQAKKDAEAKAKAAKEASDLRKQKEADQKAEMERQARNKVVDPDKTESKTMNRSSSGERLANKTKAQMEEEEEEEEKEDVEASSIAKKPKKAKKTKKPRAKNPDGDRTETERVIKEANMKRANGNLKLAKRFEEIDAEQKAIADKLTFFSAAGNEAPEKNIPRKETKRGARKRIAKEAKNAAENPEANPNQKGRKLPDFIVKDKKVAKPKPNNDARKPPRPGSKIEQFRKQKEQRQAMQVHVHRNDGQFHRNVQNNNSYFEKRVKRGLLFKPTAFQLMIKKIIHTLKRSKPEFNHINHVESTVTASMQTMTENYLTEFLDDTMKVSKHCRPTTRDKTWILLKKDIEHLYRFRNNGNPFSHHEPEAEMEAREDRKLKRH